MAKINKYWGLVAVGALTAAAAGAVASVVLKKSRDSYAAFEDDFEDDYLKEEGSAPAEEKETSEKYAQWEEDELSEEADKEETGEASEEETDKDAPEGTDAEEASDETSPEEADSKEEA